MTHSESVSWPNDSRMVVSPMVLLESWPDDLGTSKSLNRGSDRPIPDDAVYKKDLSVVRDRWFGERVGIPRLLEIFSKLSVQTTFVVNGRIVERNPLLAKEILKGGHELAAETYDHTYSFMKTAEEERRDIRKSVEIFREKLQIRPVGFLSPGLKPTIHTPEILAKEGFQYWVELDDDEFPCWLNANGQRMLSIPNMRYLNDYSTFSERGRTPEELYKIWLDTFDYLYDESDVGDGRMMLWDNHAFIAGRPNRSHYLVKFLKYIQEKEGVMTSTAKGIADWWTEKYNNRPTEEWNEPSTVPP